MIPWGQGEYCETPKEILPHILRLSVPRQSSPVPLEADFTFAGTFDKFAEEVKPKRDRYNHNDVRH